MTECEICYLQYNESMECKFICDHSVCFKCFMKLFSNKLTCPFCREEINTPNDVIFNGANQITITKLGYIDGPYLTLSVNLDNIKTREVKWLVYYYKYVYATIEQMRIVLNGYAIGDNDLYNKRWKEDALNIGTIVLALRGD